MHMQWLQHCKCWLGKHPAGRYCAYCGQALQNRPLMRFRVKSRHIVGLAGLDVSVEAIDERHALSLVAAGWHRDNLTVSIEQAA
jgi:hypothetical protein